jgi:hypothetical protein
MTYLAVDLVHFLHTGIATATNEDCFFSFVRRAFFVSREKRTKCDPYRSGFRDNNNNHNEVGSKTVTTVSHRQGKLFRSVTSTGVVGIIWRLFGVRVG